MAELQAYQNQDGETRYWGDYGSLVDELVQEHTNDLRVTVAAKIANAKETFRQRLEGLPEVQRSGMIEILAATNPYLFHTDHERRSGCPACQESGWLHGSLALELGGRGDGRVPSRGLRERRCRLLLRYLPTGWTMSGPPMCGVGT